MNKFIHEANSFLSIKHSVNENAAGRINNMFAIEVWSGSNGCARKRTVTDEPNRCSYSLPDKEIQKAIYRLRADLPAAFKWKLIHPGRTASRWRFECEKWKAKSELGSKKIQRIIQATENLFGWCVRVSGSAPCGLWPSEYFHSVVG